MQGDDARRQGLRLGLPDDVDGSEAAVLGAERAPLAELCHVGGDSSEAPAAHAANRPDALEAADAGQVQRLTEPGGAPIRRTRPCREYLILGAPVLMCKRSLRRHCGAVVLGPAQHVLRRSVTIQPEEIVASGQLLRSALTRAGRSLVHAHHAGWEERAAARRGATGRHSKGNDE